MYLELSHLHWYGTHVHTKFVVWGHIHEMVGWTDTGLIWWYSTTVLPVLLGTIGKDGQGFFRAVVAVLHWTMGIDTIGYYSTYAMAEMGEYVSTQTCVTCPLGQCY